MGRGQVGGGGGSGAEPWPLLLLLPEPWPLLLLLPEPWPLLLLQVSNCWVQNVDIVNADFGVAIESSSFCTVQNVNILATGGYACVCVGGGGGASGGGHD